MYMDDILSIINEEIQNTGIATFDMLKEVGEKYIGTSKENKAAPGLWNLIKYNGGYFKSTGQRDYMHGLSKDGVMVVRGNARGKDYVNHFYFDDQGVTKVDREWQNQGLKTAWQRPDVLNEVGEGTATPYPWYNTRAQSHNYDYEFQTQDGDNYEVVIMDIGHYWNVDFKVVGGNFEDVVNKGRLFQVMATVSEILRDFLIKESPEVLRISPAKNSNADRRRFNIYLKYFEKQLPQNYEIMPADPYIYVQKTDDIREAIREEILMEIGDAGADAYRYSRDFDTDSVAVYRFTTDSGLPYEVQFQKNVDYQNLDDWYGAFSIEGHDDTDVVNRGEVFAVMATLTKIVGEFVSDYRPSKLVFEPAKTHDSDKRRFRLYWKFIESNLPSEYEMRERNGNIVIALKPDFRK